VPHLSQVIIAAKPLAQGAGTRRSEKLSYRETVDRTKGFASARQGQFAFRVQPLGCFLPAQGKAGPKLKLEL
jgi:hypothetical protein